MAQYVPDQVWAIWHIRHKAEDTPWLGRWQVLMYSIQIYITLTSLIFPLLGKICIIWCCKRGRTQNSLYSDCWVVKKTLSPSLRYTPQASLIPRYPSLSFLNVEVVFTKLVIVIFTLLSKICNSKWSGWYELGLMPFDATSGSKLFLETFELKVILIIHRGVG